MPSSQVTVTADFAPEEQPEAGIPFTDVRKEDWFYPAVLYTYQANVMQGIGSQLFGPDQTISRAMVAQILYNIEGSPSISDAKTFQDVSLDAWYAPAVLWAANNHLVLGYETGLFEPDADISREQLAVLLFRYTEFKGLDASARGNLSFYHDSASISSWAKNAISWADAAGLMAGTDTGNLNPLDTASRAETATLFMRYLKDLSK